MGDRELEDLVDQLEDDRELEDLVERLGFVRVELGSLDFGDLELIQLPVEDLRDDRRRV